MITDNSLAPGAKVKVQSAHTGYKSRLWKVVTVDGVEQERTLLNEDTYNASKAIYRVGPAQAAPVPAPEPKHQPLHLKQERIIRLNQLRQNHSDRTSSDRDGT